LKKKKINQDEQVEEMRYEFYFSFLNFSLFICTIDKDKQQNIRFQLLISRNKKRTTKEKKKKMIYAVKIKGPKKKKKTFSIFKSLNNTRVDYHPFFFSRSLSFFFCDDISIRIFSSSSSFLPLEVYE
jgi:hypothetical protein